MSAYPYILNFYGAIHGSGSRFFCERTLSKFIYHKNYKTWNYYVHQVAFSYFCYHTKSCIEPFLESVQCSFFERTSYQNTYVTKNLRSEIIMLERQLFLVDKSNWLEPIIEAVQCILASKVRVFQIWLFWPQILGMANKGPSKGKVVWFLYQWTQTLL